MNKYIVFYFSFLTLVFSECTLSEYHRESPNILAIQSIIDPDEELVISFWSINGISEYSSKTQDSIFEVSVYENGLLVYDDKVTGTVTSTGIFPKVNFQYRIEIRAYKNSSIPPFISTYDVLARPIVLSHYANDSVKNKDPMSTQVFQNIQIQLDTGILDHPFFAYKVTSDSSALFEFDWPDTIKTTDWTPRVGTDCPEIAAPVFFKEYFTLMNLDCKENKGLLDFESRYYRPDEYQYMRFTICNIDQESMALLRQATQNGLYDSFKDEDIGLNAYFLTKDDFRKVGEHYDLVFSRTCIEYQVDY